MASFKISLLILDTHTYNKFWQMSARHPLSHTVVKLFMHSSILGAWRTAGSKPHPPTPLSQYTVTVYRSILLAVFRHIRGLKNFCGDILWLDTFSKNVLGMSWMIYCCTQTRLNMIRCSPAGTCILSGQFISCFCEEKSKNVRAGVWEFLCGAMQSLLPVSVSLWSSLW